MSPPQQQSPRGPLNDLHTAALRGSTEATIALLSTGSVNIDQVDPDGLTPLMYSVQRNNSLVTRILLNRGANVSTAADDGFTALHISASCGHLAVTLDLVEAGADLEAQDTAGCRPLHLAADEGHSEVMAALIEAGANIDSCTRDGQTPLFVAASQGQMIAVKELLQAGANSLLGATLSGIDFLPLDSAAFGGHSCVVRELIEQRGIQGCGGGSGGVHALRVAASRPHVGVMVILMDSGVVDTGIALVSAAEWAHEAAVKFLLQRRRLEGSPAGLIGYVNSCDEYGVTPLFRSISFGEDSNGVLQLISPRIVQLLVDAGADTTKALRATDAEGIVFNCGTPLAYTIQNLRRKEAGEKDLTTEQLHRLEAVRRLLLRVEAVRAVSWQWHIDASVAKRVGRGGMSKAETSSPPLRLVLPILRRRVKRRGLVLSTIFRLVVM